MQAFLTAAKNGLVVSSTRLLALPAFLASAKATSSKFFGLEHEDGILNDKLELWLYSAKCEVAPETEIQKNALKPNLIENSQLNLKLEPVDVKRGMLIRIISDRNG